MSAGELSSVVTCLACNRSRSHKSKGGDIRIAVKAKNGGGLELHGPICNACAGKLSNDPEASLIVLRMAALSLMRIPHAPDQPAS